MKAEFEEKEYEQILNIELLYDKGLIFPPGQVLENTLGFDVALFSRNPDFWALFPNQVWHYPFKYFRYFQRLFWTYPSGVQLNPNYWPLLHHHFNDPDFFPQIKFNVFIQHKRPEYLSSSAASEWKHWGKPFFRYSLMDHQQKALEILEQKIGTNGVVVYACAAFYQRKELWLASKNRNLVKNSNFCQASKLSNHGKYTYCESGNQGIGFSEPEKIISFDFNERIAQLKELKDDRDNSTRIQQLNNDILSITQDIKELQLLTSDFNEIYPFPDELEGLEIAKNFYNINVFCFLTETTLMFGIE